MRGLHFQKTPNLRALFVTLEDLRVVVDVASSPRFAADWHGLSPKQRILYVRRICSRACIIIRVQLCLYMSAEFAECERV